MIKISNDKKNVIDEESLEKEDLEEEMDDDLRKFRDGIKQGIEDFSYQKGEIYKYDQESGNIVQKHRVVDLQKRAESETIDSDDEFDRIAVDLLRTRGPVNLKFEREERAQRELEDLKELQKNDQVSGAAYGLIASMIILFALYLIKQGSESHRSEEVQAYLKGVQEWKQYWQTDFSKAKIQIVPRFCIDKHLKLRDIELCQQNIISLKEYEFQKYSQRDIRVALGLAYRNSKGMIIENENKGNITSHQYNDYSYSTNFQPTAQTEIFPKLYGLDLLLSDRHLYILINQQIVQIPNVRLLFRQKTIKSKKACYKNGGQQSGKFCVRYYKLTKLCVTVSKDVEGSQWDKWSFQNICNQEYREPLLDSRSYEQEISFTSHPFELTVKSENDPAVLWGKLTHGTGRIDVKPEYDYIVAGILIVIGCGLMTIAVIKANQYISNTGNIENFRQRNKFYLLSGEQQYDDGPSGYDKKSKVTKDEYEQRKLETEIEMRQQEKELNEQQKKIIEQINMSKE